MFVMSLILSSFLVYTIIRISAVFFPAIRFFSDYSLGVYSIVSWIKIRAIRVPWVQMAECWRFMLQQLNFSVPICLFTYWVSGGCRFYHEPGTVAVTSGISVSVATAFVPAASAIPLPHFSHAYRITCVHRVIKQEVKVPVRGHPRGSKVVPLNSWGRVSY